jgi:hypothetical protein
VSNDGLPSVWLDPLPSIETDWFKPARSTTTACRNPRTRSFQSRYTRCNVCRVSEANVYVSFWQGRSVLDEPQAEATDPAPDAHFHGPLAVPVSFVEFPSRPRGIARGVVRRNVPLRAPNRTRSWPCAEKRCSSAFESTSIRTQAVRRAPALSSTIDVRGLS